MRFRTTSLQVPKPRFLSSKSVGKSLLRQTSLGESYFEPRCPRKSRLLSSKSIDKASLDRCRWGKVTLSHDDPITLARRWDPSPTDRRIILNGKTRTISRNVIRSPRAPVHIKIKCLGFRCYPRFLQKAMARSAFDAVGPRRKRFKHRVSAITVRTRCAFNLHGKTRTFLQKTPFRTILRFYIQVSCIPYFGASKSARFRTKPRIYKPSIWEKWNRTSAFEPSVLDINLTPSGPLHCFFPRLFVYKCSILWENTHFLDYRKAGVLEKSAFKPGEDRFPDKVSEVIFKKSAQMREIAFGPVFPSKVSWTLDRLRPWPEHFQTKCPA